MAATTFLSRRSVVAESPDTGNGSTRWIHHSPGQLLARFRKIRRTHPPVGSASDGIGSPRPSGQARAHASEGSGNRSRGAPAPPLLIPIHAVSARGQEVAGFGRTRDLRAGRGRRPPPSFREGGVARGADIATRNLDDRTRALSRIRTAAPGRWRGHGGFRYADAGSPARA